MRESEREREREREGTLCNELLSISSPNYNFCTSPCVLCVIKKMLQIVYVKEFVTFGEFFCSQFSRPCKFQGTTMKKYDSPS